MEKLNITKGIAHIDRQDNQFTVFINQDLEGERDFETGYTVDIIGMKSVVVASCESKEVADLIKDAHNVANETGLTPRELLNQRNELLEALAGGIMAMEGFLDNILTGVHDKKPLSIAIPMLENIINGNKSAINNASK